MNETVESNEQEDYTNIEYINIWNIKLNDKFINYNEWTTSFEYKLPLCLIINKTRKLHDSVLYHLFILDVYPYYILWDIFMLKTFRFDGSHEYKVTKMWTISIGHGCAISM